MDAGYTVFEKLGADFRAMFHAELADRLIVARVFLEPLPHRTRNLGSAKEREPFHLFGGEERKDARDDWDADVVFVLKIRFHVEKIAGVVKELGDQEFRTRFDFAGGEIPVAVFDRVFDMPFGVRRRSDAELPLFLDETHEIGAVAESPFHGLELRLTFGGIAPQRQNIFDTLRTDVLKKLPDLLLGVSHAREMRKRLDAMVAAKALHQAYRSIACTSTSAVGHGDERRPQSFQSRDRIAEERFLGFFGFGRKKFERNRWLGAVVKFAYSHDAPGETEGSCSCIL